jgi:hypothetical protein
MKLLSSLLSEFLFVVVTSISAVMYVHYCIVCDAVWFGKTVADILERPTTSLLLKCRYTSARIYGSTYAKVLFFIVIPVKTQKIQY